MSLDSLMAELNEKQQVAATLPNIDTLVLAGAGTGKTKTIIARAAFLISSGVPANKIQILTFTRRSSAEIVERVKWSMGESAYGLRASTFHRWCMSLMRSAPNQFGYNDYSIIDRDDQLQLFKLLRGSVPKGTLPTPAQLCDLYSYARNTGISLTDSINKQLPDFEKKKDKIEPILRAYEAKKKSRKYLDYDDILAVVAYRLSNSEKAVEWIKYSHDVILIDEMQDTNPLQWKILQPLIGKVSLFCVGDDAQSIFGFRGADFTNIHSFTESVPNSQMLKLEDNYRSTQEILDVSNWLLKQSPIDYSKQLVAVRGLGIKPQLHDFLNEHEEASWIADDISERNENGVLWSNHMILVRSAYTARTLESALLRKGIPYRFIGGTALFQSAHVRDVISALRIVANVLDEIAWMRFLTLWPGVGDKTASDVVAYLFQSGVTNISEAIHRLTSTTLSPNIGTVLIAISECGDNVSESVDIAFKSMESRLQEIYKKADWNKRKSDFPLIKMIAEKHSSILDFIEEYVLNPIYESQVKSSETTNKVTIITIHSAKGSECEICYIVDVGPGAYPAAWAVNNIDDVEEERRVLYVALTRAKNELILTRRLFATSARKNRRMNDSEVEVAESYFFNDLPEELVENQVHIPDVFLDPDDSNLEAPLEEIGLGINFD